MSRTTTNLGLYVPAQGEHYGTHMDDNLDALDAAIGPGGAGGASQEWTTLKNAVSAGATSVVLNPAPSLMSQRSYTGLLIDVGNNQFDYKSVTPSSVSGNTVTVSALDYAHSAGASVAVLGVQPVVRASWIGGISGSAGNTSGNATRNTAAFNRFASHSGVVVATGRGAVLALDGDYYINDTVNIQGGSLGLRGLSGCNTGDGLIAHTSFVFDSLGAKQMLNVQDQFGAGNTYNSFLADITTWLDDFFLDGNDVTDSIGLVHSPQQPGHGHNLRFRHFKGLTSYQYGGQNVWDMQNFQFDHCTAPVFGHIISQMRDMNTTSANPVGGVYTSLRINGISFILLGGDLEDVPDPGPLISIEGGATSVQIDNVWTSGLDTASTGVMINVDTPSIYSGASASLYDIRGFRCNQGATTLKVLRDVQRGFSIQAFSTDIPDRTLFAFAAAGHAEYRNASGVITTASSGVPHAA